MFHRRGHILDEFAVLGAFVLVSTIGLLYGGLLLFLAVAVEPTSYATLTMRPPLDREYRRQVRAAVGPFFVEVLKRGTTAAGSGDSALAVSAVAATEALLKIRVPGEERETHLSLVLLLEQWRRALSGSVADQDAVLERTHLFLQEHQWISG